ncbi:restriction endonuclease subunit S [uncultured Proteiniphilum sp.]|uniref:restriction endonuclease subunit S n=1 Tax=uncultured Proteiniphilum sp. TaxID=497637 RepID=UPI00261D5835|nr:restriction endonuclease subunit S [uncultured Proteiniphilum sp.]
MWTCNSTYKYSIHFSENQAINDNLEISMRTLFDFHFNKIHCKSNKYKIVSLTEIASFTNGLAMQKFRPKENEKGIPVLKIKELGQGFCDSSSDICSSTIKSDYLVDDGDVIFSWSGTLLVDIWSGGKCGLNQHLFKVTSDKYPLWFAYLWTLRHLDKFIRIAKDKAVTMGHIKRSDLEKSDVLILDNKMMQKLDKLFTPVLNSCISIRVENRKLSALRDSLLPKLMSGELKINDLHR